MKGSKESFTPKAVETIQSILGITLTQEQIDKGYIKFTVKSRWDFLNNPNHPSEAVIGRDFMGMYYVKVTQYPDPCPSCTALYKSAKTVAQLKKACEALKNY